MKTVNHHREGIYTSFKLALSAFTKVVQWIEELTFSSNWFWGFGFSTFFFLFFFNIFFTLFFTYVVHIASNIMWQIECKVYGNIKNAVCIIAYCYVLRRSVSVRRDRALEIQQAFYSAIENIQKYVTSHFKSVMQVHVIWRHTPHFPLLSNH